MDPSLNSYTLGYIGGSVLSKLLRHPSSDTFDITIIVRSEEKAKKFESLGVKAVVGSFKQDHDLLQRCTENAHVVFSCVRNVNIPSSWH